MRPLQSWSATKYLRLSLNFRHIRSFTTRSPFSCRYRCPETNPTWCISKRAAAKWIRGYGRCDESINFDCDGTDICATSDGLFFGYDDTTVNIAPALYCVKFKCESQWSACCKANPTHQRCAGFGQGKDRCDINTPLLYTNIQSSFMARCRQLKLRIFNR